MVGGLLVLSVAWCTLEIESNTRSIDHWKGIMTATAHRSTPHANHPSQKPLTQTSRGFPARSGHSLSSIPELPPGRGACPVRTDASGAAIIAADAHAYSK